MNPADTKWCLEDYTTLVLMINSALTRLPNERALVFSESRTQGEHTEQYAAGRPDKVKMGNQGKRVGRDRGGTEGQAGVYQQHEPTHDSQSKTYGNPSPPRGYQGLLAQRK